MNLRSSTIGLILVISMMCMDWSNAQKDYGDKTKAPKPTKIEDRTTKRVHHKKTKATESLAASTAALLETTSQVPVVMESTTIAQTKPSPAPPATDKPTPSTATDESTPAAPLMTTTRKRGQKKPKTPQPTLPPVDFDCKGKRDGYYADPKDKCSNKYYACVGGLARQMTCAPGNLVFDADGRFPACVHRDESFRCSGIRRTTTPQSATSPRGPLPTPEKLPIDCTSKDDGWFADPDKKCSHIFYSCSGGEGDRFECPGKKYFDDKLIRCLDREEVEACGGKRPTPTTTPASAGSPTPAPATTKSPLDCSEKPSGYYPDPEKKCSSIYYSCSNGDTIKLQCPGKLFFDPATSLCEYEEDIFACTGKTKPPPTTTVAPKPSPASLPTKEFNCKGKRNGGYTPEGQKCSNKFFKCVDGVATKMMCVKDTFYDVESDKCLRRDELFVCTNRKPTQAILTTVKPKPTEKLAIDCKSKKDGDYPDPEKQCSHVYYSCSGSVGSRRLCAGRKTFFDKELGICDERMNVPACSGKPRPLTPRPSPRPTKTPEKVTYDCSQKKDGWYADDKNKCSNIYYGCVGGQATRETCASPDTFFDSEIGECGYRQHVPACGGVRPVDE